EGEDPAFRLLAAEELVEQVPAVVQGVLGGQGHLVAGPAGVGEALACEGVEGLVDGLGLGEAGGGVVEVDGHWLAHAGASGGNRSAMAIGPTVAVPRVIETIPGGVITWRWRYVGFLPARGRVYASICRSGMFTIQYTGMRARA